MRLVQWKEEEEMKSWDLGFKKKENNIKGNFSLKEWKEDKGKGGGGVDMNEQDHLKNIVRRKGRRGGTEVWDFG